ncbi:glucose-inhibited division protein B [Stanieria sp. NIES-3757]|nr:glucose-inhibited division protein B [Stanieria sp. NIES-3757]
MRETNPENLPEMSEIWQKTLQWQPNNRQQQYFIQIYQEIIQGNRKLNLTRITSPEEFWEKHLWDSLAGLLDFPLDTHPKLNVIDIGTGGGFPGLPMAVVFPHWQVTLLDSTRKKIAFLSNLASKIGLTNVKTLVARAEVIGQQLQHRETYDLATIRAVGTASVCAEYALPLVKLGGLAILYRGHWQAEDTEALESVASELGSKIEAIAALTTPITHSIRHCIYLRKHSPTPKQYPRAVGVPNQQPL